MQNVTEEFFPKGMDWHRYMTLVAKEAGILPKIEFGVEVQQVLTNKDAQGGEEGPCLLLTNGARRCAKHRLFIGTGLKEKKQPLLEAMGAIPYSKATVEMAKKRRVCILGNGNSAFELAQNVYKVAERVILYGRHEPRLSSVTRYTGDLRIKYLQILENFNMKMLDTVDFFVTGLVKTSGLEKQLTPEQIDTVEKTALLASWLHDYQCETFFTATGFESSIPGGLTMKSDARFPTTKDWYQAVIDDDMDMDSKVHYIGWLMHERDFRISAGGFLSGFRYLIRNLAYHVREEDAGVPYPHFVMTRDEVIAKVVERCQIAHDIFILQDGVAIRDIILPSLDEPGTYTYYEGTTHEFHRDLKLDAREDVISLYFEWGHHRHVAFAFEGLARYEDQKSLLNVFLHPAIEVNGMVRQVQEDVKLEWIEYYAAAVDKTIRSALDGNMDGFYPQQFNPWKPSKIKRTLDNYFEGVSPPAPVDESVVKAIWRSVYSEESPDMVASLRDAMKKWHPTPFEPHSLLMDENHSDAGVAQEF